MSKNVKVKIIKKSYTPRSSLHPNHFNVILNFEASVPSNSYVFSGALTTELPRLTDFIKALDDLRKRLEKEEKLDTGYITSLTEKYVLRKRFGASKKFPKISEKFLLPGSSIKGAIRSRIEYKFKPFLVGEKYYSYACYIVQNPFIDRSFARHHLNFWGEEVSYAREHCKPPNVCIICDIFGCPELSSRVHISDAVLTKGSTELLDDLDKVEAVKPSSMFSLKITGFNLSLLDLGLIFLGLELYSGSPVLIGAYKYRFNPVLERKLFRGKFTFGLLKFKLNSFKEHAVEKVLEEIKTPKDLIREAKNALDRSEYAEHIDYNKGVLA